MSILSDSACDRGLFNAALQVHLAGMTLAALADTLPAYAADVARNLVALEAETTLTPTQLWGAVLAGSMAVGTPAVIQAAETGALQAGLGERAQDGARAAAAVMAQNNVYFRAIDLMDDPVLAAEPSHLRMSVTQKPQALFGVDPLDFHLWTLAVSAINGCGACLQAQAEELRVLGARPALISAALRVAALIHAASRILAAEAART